jgi:hypothetical protein
VVRAGADASCPCNPGFGHCDVLMGPGHVAAPSRATDTLWGSDAVPIYALDYAP